MSSDITPHVYSAATIYDATLRELRCGCGNDAACIGRYEDMPDDEPACNECCGHGCEDGYCTYLTDEDGEYTDEARTRVAAYLNRSVA